MFNSPKQRIWRRNYATAGMAIALSGLLIWAMNAKDDKRISRISTSGILLEINQYTMDGKYGESTNAMGLVQAVDGNKTRLSMPRPFPLKGDNLPLFKEEYESGNILYAVDHERWMMGE